MNGHSDRKRTAWDLNNGFHIKHPNGQSSFVQVDSFVDPWIPRSQVPVILIQHGCVHTTEHFYHWVPSLARNYIVIRRDARGHGQSSFPKRLTSWAPGNKDEYEGGYQWNMDTIVDEVVDTLDQLEVSKVIFIGEATSGEVGEVLAAKYPDRVSHLITCSSPTHLPPKAIELLSVGETSWPEAVIKLGPRGWTEALAKRPGTIPLSEGKDYINWWYDAVDKTHREGLAGYVIFLTTADARPYLKDVKCPMLILAPTHSAATPPAESEFLQSQVPQSKLVFVDGPGHEIYVENAAGCLKAIHEFLGTAV